MLWFSFYRLQDLEAYERPGSLLPRSRTPYASGLSGRLVRSRWFSEERKHTQRTLRRLVPKQTLPTGPRLTFALNTGGKDKFWLVRTLVPIYQLECIYLDSERLQLLWVSDIDSDAVRRGQHHCLIAIGVGKRRAKPRARRERSWIRGFISRCFNLFAQFTYGSDVDDNRSIIRAHCRAISDRTKSIMTTYALTCGQRFSVGRHRDA